MRTLKLVGVFGKNSEEWITFDLACVCYDFVSVTLYDTLGIEATDFIIN
jgi:long-subunit acyl-CoA synthetase (AMP-forming)